MFLLPHHKLMLVLLEKTVYVVMLLRRNAIIVHSSFTGSFKADGYLYFNKKLSLVPNKFGVGPMNPSSPFCS